MIARVLRVERRARANQPQMEFATWLLDRLTDAPQWR